MHPVANDAAFATTPQERAMANAGVPRAFWHTRVRDVVLAGCRFGSRVLVPREQAWHLRCLVEDPRQQLCCFSTAQQDDAGLALAVAVVNALQTRVALLDAQYLPSALEHWPQAVVIHNVLASATDRRLEAVRDACLRFQKVIRILVVAGTRDPAGWCLNKLRLLPSVCCVARKVKAS